jgi:hypothetical protein
MTGTSTIGLEPAAQQVADMFSEPPFHRAGHRIPAGRARNRLTRPRTNAQPERGHHRSCVT